MGKERRDIDHDFGRHTEPTPMSSEDVAKMRNSTTAIFIKSLARLKEKGTDIQGNKLGPEELRKNIDFFETTITQYLAQSGPLMNPEVVEKAKQALGVE